VFVSDKLVPVQQADTFVQRATTAGATAKLMVKPGTGHDWPNPERELTSMADWFDEYLRGLKK